MMRQCPACGKTAEATAKFCTGCGKALPVAPATGVDATPAPEKIEMSTALAVIGSALFPGLGQVYEGNILRGYLIFFGTLLGLFVFILPGIAVWLYGIYDAYATAAGMNNGTFPGKPAPVLHMMIFVIVAVVIAILLFVLLALMLFAISGPEGVTITVNSTGIENPVGPIFGI